MLKSSASNGKVKSHARDYTGVEISEDVPFQAGEFKPCAELSGKTAKITFITADRKACDGEIQSIEVEKYGPQKKLNFYGWAFLRLGLLINNFPADDCHHYRSF